MLSQSVKVLGSQHMMINKHKRPLIEAAEDDGVPTMEIVDGVEEDLVLSESEYNSDENE